MTLADKLISLNKALATIDSLLLDAEHPSDVKVYSNLYAEVSSVYLALSEEWLEENNPANQK